MHVADRETYDDVFCMECGRIADRETLTTDGLCEDCTPKGENVEIETLNAVAIMNDEFRKQVLRSKMPTGKAVMTAGIQALGNMAQAYIFQLVMNHRDFPKGNDPYGEHDFWGYRGD